MGRATSATAGAWATGCWTGDHAGPQARPEPCAARVAAPAADSASSGGRERPARGGATALQQTRPAGARDQRAPGSRRSPQWRFPVTTVPALLLPRGADGLPGALATASAACGRDPCLLGRRAGDDRGRRRAPGPGPGQPARERSRARRSAGGHHRCPRRRATQNHVREQGPTRRAGPPDRPAARPWDGGRLRGGKCPRGPFALCQTRSGCVAALELPLAEPGYARAA
jgi:hypothetical protein